MREPRRRPFDIVTFDCYGTLIDWEGGIASAFAAEAAREGVSVSAARVLELHAELEPAIQAGPYRSYREVLKREPVAVTGTAAALCIVFACRQHEQLT